MSKFDIIKKEYIDKHLKIFPVIPNGKTPSILAWQHDCSTDVMQIIYWLTQTPDCNIGLPANENNLFILDIDVHDANGIESFRQLLDNLNIDKINTLTQITPSGGYHYIFKSDDDLCQVLNTSNCFAGYPGIDCRTKGYVVVYPSKINEKEYKFINDIPPQPMPKALKDFILSTGISKKDSFVYKKPTKVLVGDRDNQMFQYIYDLYYKTRLDIDEIRVLCEYFNENILERPLPQSVIDYKIKKIFEKDRGNCLFIKID